MDFEKIHVFGSSGYLGKTLVQALEKRGRPVIGYGRSGGNVYFDLEQDSTVEDFELLKAGDIVVYLSAVSSPEVCNEDYDRAYRINVINTKIAIRKMLEKGALVIFASSDVVYEGGEKIFDERSLTCPLPGYGSMKLEVENEFLADLNFRVIRLSYIWSKMDKFTQFLCTQALSGKAVEVYHPFVRNIVCLSDVLDFFFKFMQNPKEIGKITNIGGPEPISRLEFVEAIAANNCLDFKIGHDDKKFFAIRQKVIKLDTSEFSKILGRPPVSVKEKLLKLRVGCV